MDSCRSKSSVIIRSFTYNFCCDVVFDPAFREPCISLRTRCSKEAFTNHNECKRTADNQEQNNRFDVFDARSRFDSDKSVAIHQQRQNKHCKRRVDHNLKLSQVTLASVRGTRTDQLLERNVEIALKLLESILHRFLLFITYLYITHSLKSNRRGFGVLGGLAQWPEPRRGYASRGPTEGPVGLL